MPGSGPLVHVAPLSELVAKPMSDAPPSKKRPSCAAATIVEPNENVSGSTIVLCWLVVLVNGSTAIGVSAACALAVADPHTTSTPAAASANNPRRRSRDEALKAKRDPPLPGH